MNFDDETILENPDDSGKNANPYLNDGTKLGDYELIKLLGAGAMGEVYLARQVVLDQKCALKVLPQKFASSADFEQRFIAEGRVLAKMDHPNVVRVTYAGTSDKWHYLAMEYIEGGSLDDYLVKSGDKLTETEVRSILSDILSGLAYAHKLGIVHRDLKPANILRTNEGHCKISDFGLATVAGRQYVQEMVRKSMTASAPLDPDATILEGSENVATKSRSAREIVGTIHYISPEVMKTGTADARSDIYAVGVMAYQMLTGQTPAAMAKMPSKAAKGVSPAWDEWVAKCMDAAPDERFQSADDALMEMPLQVGDKSRKSSEKSQRKNLLPIVAASVVAAVAIAATVAFVFFARRPVENSGEPVKITDAKVKTDVAEPARDSEPHKSLFSQLDSAKGEHKENAASSEAPAEHAESAAEEPVPKETVAFTGPKAGESWTVPDVALEMVWIAEGRFEMGSPTSEQGRSGDEGPKHRVTISKGFWMGKFEVTQGQWKKIMGGNPSKFASLGENAPVENVSWDDAAAFCEELTKREKAAHRLPKGCEYTLPPEARWEYACRAGSYSRYSGADAPGDVAWFAGNSENSTHVTGGKAPNAWGLYDMHGNVGEWCRDFAGPYSAEAATDPTGPSTGAMHIFRGGGYNSDANSCRSAYRNKRVPSYTYGNLGFRVVLTPVTK